MGVKAAITSVFGVGASPRPPLAGAILHARIVHARLGRKRYVLRHRLWYLRVRLADLARLDRPLMRHNRAGTFALLDRDHGDGTSAPADWLRRAFQEVGSAMPDGETVLVTLPRVLGLGFNPVSFWLCHDAAGGLRAMIAEVNNTFGERHCYMVQKPDGQPIVRSDAITARKVFHVSPFLPVDGTYIFRVAEHADRLSIRIDLVREGKLVLMTSISGPLAPLTSSAVALCFLRYPLPVVQVVGFIHVHAARLYMRGLEVFTKPPPPAAGITASDRTADNPRRTTS